MASLTCSKWIRFYQYPSTSASTAVAQQAFGHGLDASVYPSRWNEWIQYLEFNGFELAAGYTITSATLNLALNTSSELAGKNLQQLFTCYGTTRLLTTSDSWNTVRNSQSSVSKTGGSGWTSIATYSLDITNIIKTWGNGKNGLILRTQETSSNNAAKFKPLLPSDISIDIVSEPVTLTKPTVIASKSSGLVKNEQITFNLSSAQGLTTFAYSYTTTGAKTACGASLTIAPNHSSIYFFVKNGANYSPYTKINLAYKPIIALDGEPDITHYTARNDDDQDMNSNWVRLVKPHLKVGLFEYNDDTSGTVSVYLSYRTARSGTFTNRLITTAAFNKVNNVAINIVDFVHNNGINGTNGIDYKLIFKYTLNGQVSNTIDTGNTVFSLAQPPIAKGIINQAYPNTDSKSPATYFPSFVTAVYTYDESITSINSFTIGSTINGVVSKKWSNPTNFRGSAANKIMAVQANYNGTEYAAHRITASLQCYGTTVSQVANLTQFTPFNVVFTNTKFGLLTTNNTAITNRFMIYKSDRWSVNPAFGIDKDFTSVVGYTATNYTIKFSCNNVTKIISNDNFSLGSGFGGKILGLQDKNLFYDFDENPNSFGIDATGRTGSYDYTVTFTLTSNFGDSVTLSHTFDLNFYDPPTVTSITLSPDVTANNQYLIEGMTVTYDVVINCHEYTKTPKKVSLQVERLKKGTNEYEAPIMMPGSTVQNLTITGNKTKPTGANTTITFSVKTGELDFSTGNKRRFSVTIDDTPHNEAPAVANVITHSAPAFSVEKVTTTTATNRTQMVVESTYTPQTSSTPSLQMKADVEGNTATSSVVGANTTLLFSSVIDWELKIAQLTLSTTISSVISNSNNTYTTYTNKKSTVVSYKLFTTVPTVAYRKNQLGINTDKLLTADVVTISMPDSNKRRIRLLGPTGETFIYNLNHTPSTYPLPISQGGTGGNTGFKALAQLFGEAPTFTTLTPQNEATSITGGYVQIGKLVIVQCTITITAITQSIRTVASIFPQPATNYVGMSVGHSSTGSTINALINNDRVLRFNGPCDAGIYYISGIYFSI